MNTTSRQLGRRARLARLKLELTQNELAERLEVEEATVRAIEAGRRGVSVETLLKLCRTLHISVDGLLGEAPVAWDGHEHEAARLVADLNMDWKLPVLRILREIHRIAGEAERVRGNGRRRSPNGQRRVNHRSR